MSTNDGAERKQVAYYYPEPYWFESDGDWLKTLLLFFDSVSILLPRYMRGRELRADPVMAGAMTDAGLLQILEPEEFVDSETTQALTSIMLELLHAGAFDDLEREDYYAALSRSRMGWVANVELSGELIDELRRQGLAREPKDPVSVPLQPVVRTTILVLLSQLARDAGHRRGLDLHPVTADLTAFRSLERTLALPSTPSAGHYVALDLEAAAIDLSAVPIDEILDFKSTNGKAFRDYAVDVRKFAALLSPLDEDGRRQLLLDRRSEFEERGRDLRKTARSRWRRPAANVGLGAAGAFWAVVRGDPISAALSMTRGLLGVNPSSQSAGAYSYILTARSRYGRIGGDR